MVGENTNLKYTVFKNKFNIYKYSDVVYLNWSHKTAKILCENYENKIQYIVKY